MNIKKLCFLLAISIAAFNGQAQEVISIYQAIELGLKNNYDIRLNKNIVETTETDSHYSFGLFTPDLTGSAFRLWTINDQRQTLADNSERNKKGIRSDNLNASVQMNWLLFDGTRMFITKKKLEEIALQSNLSLQEQINNSTATVITNYYDIVREKQQYRALKEQITISETRVKLAEKRLEVGTGSKPELLQAKVDLNAQRSTIIEQEALITQLKIKLDNVLGNQLPEQFEVADSIPLQVNPDKESLLTTIEESNPSLSVYKKYTTIAFLELKERKAERFPLISFNSAYNFTRNNNKAVINPFSPLFTQNKGFNYGFTATLPLFRGFETKRAIRQAEYKYQYQQLFYEQQKLSMTASLKSAFADYEKAIKVLRIEEENIGLAKENVFIALERSKRGTNTFIEVRTAQISLEDAYNRLIIARYNAKIAETELLRLNGDLLR